MSTSSQTKTPPHLAFIDTETTHLSPQYGDAWEIATIVRRPGRPDIEHLYQVRVSLAEADPKSLEIGRFNERFAVPEGHIAASHTDDGWQPITEAQLMVDLMADLDGAVIVGSNPAFDEGFLAKMFTQAGVKPRWHYRAIDIVPLAAGFLYGRAHEWTKKTCDASWYGRVAKNLGFPWKSYDACEAIGVARPDGYVAHTALGDARWARDVYDAVTLPDAFYAASDDQLSAMVGEALSSRGEFIGCARTGCPNGEWQGYAVERGWTTYRGQLQCPKHDAADGSK